VFYLRSVSTTRVDGPSWRVSKNAPEFMGRQLGPWTRAVNSGSGNRPLVSMLYLCLCKIILCSYCVAVAAVLQELSCESHSLPENEILMLTLYNRSWSHSFPFTRAEVRHSSWINFYCSSEMVTWKCSAKCISYYTVKSYLYVVHNHIFIFLSTINGK